MHTVSILLSNALALLDLFPMITLFKFETFPYFYLHSLYPTLLWEMVEEKMLLRCWSLRQSYTVYTIFIIIDNYSLKQNYAYGINIIIECTSIIWFISYDNFIQIWNTSLLTLSVSVSILTGDCHVSIISSSVPHCL